jgi:hypothetical protein
MSIHIDNRNNLDKRDKLRDLIINGKIGDALSLYAGYGYKHLVFHCIKMGSKTANVYGYDRGWYNRIDHKIPAIRITKDHFTFLSGNFSHIRIIDQNAPNIASSIIGNWSYTFRGFLSMGIIPYAGLRYLRNGTLVNFSDNEVATFYPMKVDWDGNLLSRIPKKVKDYTEKCYKDDRDIKNRAARSNYGNTRVVRLIKEAKETDNWNKIKPVDTFSLTNVTKRTELIRYFGMETILESVPNMRIDEDEIDGRKYELLRFSFPAGNSRPLDTETVPATYLKMINPSTGETCVEGVPNNATNSWSRDITMNTVKEALAWRDEDLDNIYLEPVALT